MTFRSGGLGVMAAVLCACSGGGTDTPDGGGGDGANPWDAGPGLPAAPLGVHASRGTSTDHVAVRWEVEDEATSYNVYRDGTRIAAPDGRARRG